MGKDTGKKQSWDKQFQDLVSRKAKLAYDRRGGKASPNCTSFYAKSSIPGAGYSVFAGRDYEQGDVVVRYCDPVLFCFAGTNDMFRLCSQSLIKFNAYTLLPINLSVPQQTQFPTGDFLPTTLNSQDDKNLFIQQYAYLLKYHHLESNLEGQAFATKLSMSEATSTSEDYQLRASKPIQAGDELLLPFSQHPMSQLEGSSHHYFDSIPNSEEFSIAEDIIRDEVERFKYRRGAGSQQPKAQDIGTSHCSRVACLSSF